jgi:hypothetical protein
LKNGPHNEGQEARVKRITEKVLFAWMMSRTVIPWSFQSFEGQL